MVFSEPRRDNALSEVITHLYEPAAPEYRGVVTVLNYAAILYRSLMNRRSVDASAMLQSTFSMIIVLAHAGCGAGSFTSGSARGDAEFQLERAACYREAKLNYEAAGAGPDPNAALMNIGAALIAKDNAFEQCTPARGLQQTK